MNDDWFVYVNFQVPPSARYIYGGVLEISPTRYLSGYILNIYLYNLSWLPLGSNVLVLHLLDSVFASQALFVLGKDIWRFN